MNYFEQRLASDIVRKVASRLVEFDFNLSSKSELKRHGAGIKDTVSSGLYEIKIVTDNTFVVDLNSRDFSLALSKDFSDGWTRINSIYRSFLDLRESNEWNAWGIVTLYYVGFFSAVEILRAQGEYISFFDKNSLSTIQQSATVNAGVLESGSYQGIASCVASSGIVSIRFVKSNVRHHQFAWQSIAKLTKESCKYRSRHEIEIVKRVVDSLGSRSRNEEKFQSPSDTRNHWNYEDSTLFGEKGKCAAVQLVKLMKSPGKSLQWVRNKSNYGDLGNATCALGFSSDFLKIAFELLGDRIVPS